MSSWYLHAADGSPEPSLAGKERSGTSTGMAAGFKGGRGPVPLGVAVSYSTQIGKYHSLSLPASGGFVISSQQSSFNWADWPMGDPYNADDYATVVGEPQAQSRAEMPAFVSTVNYIYTGGTMKHTWYRDKDNTVIFQTSYTVPDPKSQGWEYWIWYSICSWTGKFPHEIYEPGRYRVVSETSWGTSTTTYCVLGPATVDVRVAKGAGTINVYKNGTYIGSTSSSQVFSFQTCDTFKFEAVPANYYTFEKFCADTGCATSTPTNPFTGTIITSSGSLYTYFKGNAAQVNVQVTQGKGSVKVSRNGVLQGETSTSQIFLFEVGDSFKFEAAPTQYYLFKKFCADAGCTVTTALNPFSGTIVQPLGNLYTYFEGAPATVDVKISKGTGTVKVYRNGAYLGETSTSQKYDFLVGDAFEFQARPKSYFEKFCADTACATTTASNPFKGTIVQPTGTLYSYFTSVPVAFNLVHITDLHISPDVCGGFDPDGRDFKVYAPYLASLSPKPAFVLAGGDISNGGNKDSGQAYLNMRKNLYPQPAPTYPTPGALFLDSAQRIPVYFIPGNHDYRSNNCLASTTDLAQYHQYVNQKDDYYFVKGNVLFIGMNSGQDKCGSLSNCVTLPEGTGFTDSQMTWLDGPAGLLQEYIAFKKVILMHHPAVNGDGPEGAADGSIVTNRDRFLKDCKDFKVDVVLQGHWHSDVVAALDASNNKVVIGENDTSYGTRYVKTGSSKRGGPYRTVAVDSTGTTITVGTPQNLPMNAFEDHFDTNTLGTAWKTTSSDASSFSVTGGALVKTATGVYARSAYSVDPKIPANFSKLTISWKMRVDKNGNVLDNDSYFRLENSSSSILWRLGFFEDLIGGKQLNGTWGAFKYAWVVGQWYDFVVTFTKTGGTATVKSGGTTIKTWSFTSDKVTGADHLRFTGRAGASLDDVLVVGTY